jgi:4-hydroxythreonine-4-phosphate dehydrogenase
MNIAPPRSGFAAPPQGGTAGGPAKPDPRRSLGLLLTMGDPVGIGPEIIARAFVQGAAEGCAVVGDVRVMRRAMALLPEPWPVAALDAPDEPAPPRCLPVWQPDALSADLAALPWGRVEARAGAAAAACIEAAVRAVQRGAGRAIVTAPVHKAALAAAGVPYPGHTEMLQALAGGAPVRMMLANDELRVVLVTIHQSLRTAIEAVTFDAVLETLRIAHASAQRWPVERPARTGQRIAVAGLNPHAGEDGLFGDEERLVIAPAIAAARAHGIDAHGPFAPDTVFMRARRGEFDLVVAMTHDHGLIPVKYLGVEQGVNVTLGLPFVRTSPDHGTAFDIAGHGVADASSLAAAIGWARKAVSGA